MIALPIIEHVVACYTVAIAVFHIRKSTLTNDISTCHCAIATDCRVDPVVVNVCRILDDGARCAAITHLLLLGHTAIAVIRPGGGQGGGIAAPISGGRHLLGLLDVTDRYRVGLIEFGDQVAIPRAAIPTRVHPTGRTRRAVAAARRLQLRCAVGVVILRIHLAPMRGVVNVPPRIALAGRDDGRQIARVARRHFAGVIHPPAFAGVGVMHLKRAIGPRHRGGIEAHEGGIIIVQIIPVGLVAPIHPHHAVATLLGAVGVQAVVVDILAVQRGTRLLPALPCLAELDDGVIPLRQHDAAPCLVIGGITGIRRLGAGAGGGAIEGTRGRDAGGQAMRVVARILPGEGGVQPLTIIHRRQVAVVARMTYAPQRAARARTVVARPTVPGKAAVSRRVGIEGRVDVALILRAVAQRRRRIRCAAIIPVFLNRRQVQVACGGFLFAGRAVLVHLHTALTERYLVHYIQCIKNEGKFFNSV